MFKRMALLVATNLAVMLVLTRAPELVARCTRVHALLPSSASLTHH